MRRSWFSSRLGLRLLCGVLLLMALVDFPLEVTQATGRVVGVLVLFGVLAGAGLLTRRRRAPDDIPHVVVTSDADRGIPFTQFRALMRGLVILSLGGGATLLVWLRMVHSAGR